VRKQFCKKLLFFAVYLTFIKRCVRTQRRFGRFTTDYSDFHG